MSTLTGLPTGAAGERRFERLDEKLRVQHALMIVSFVTCVVTGFPLKYPDWAWMQVIVDALGGVTVTRILHRVGAVVMTADFVWHLVDMVLRIRRGRLRITQIEMLPTLRDVREFVQNVGSFLGLASKPRFGRLNYMHKFDYWAVFWGMAIMVGSGLVMWFPEFFGRFLPTRWIVATWIAHSDEGLLAFLAIAVWHIFNVHLDPRTFPMSRLWLDGTLTESEMKHEHPREYERVKDLPSPPGLGTYRAVKAVLGVFVVLAVLNLAYGLTRPAKPARPEGVAEYAERVAKQSLAGLSAESPLYDEALQARRRELHDHFHRYDPPETLPFANRSACLLSGCHTEYPHQRTPEVRAYMNMHTAFLTCETCHFSKVDVGTVRYDWFDHGMKDHPLAKAPPAGVSRDEKTGELVGMDNYVRKIAPFWERDGRREVVFRPGTDPKALEYERVRNRMTSEMIARVKAEFHRDIQPAGPLCMKCHSVNGMLDYRALGFSPARVRELEMLRVAVFYFWDAQKTGYNVPTGP